MDGLIRKQLIKEVRKRSDGKYQLEMGAFESSFWSSTIDIHDVQLIPDSTLYASDSSFRLNNVSLAVPHLSIDDIGIWHYISSKELDVGNIIFKHPELTLHKAVQDSASKQPPLALQIVEAVTKVSKHLKIRSIAVDSGKVYVNVYNKGKVIKQSVEELNFRLEHTKVSKADRDASRSVLFSEEAALSLGSYALTLPSGLQLSFDNLKMGTRDSTLYLDRFRVHEDDKLTLTVDQLKLAHIGVHTYFFTRRLMIDTIYALKPHLQLFKDQEHESGKNIKETILDITLQNISPSGS